jgi:hypothetical protein
MPDDDRSYEQAPGASGPGDPAYRGEVTIGDEGAAASPMSFVDPDATEEEAEVAITPEVQEQWARADAKTAEVRNRDE